MRQVVRRMARPGEVTWWHRRGDYSAHMPTDTHASARGSSRDDRRGGSADGPDPSPRSRPIVALLLGIEALLLAAAATYCFVAVSGGDLHARLGIGLGVFLLLFALLLGLAARSILQRGRFGLGWGITWQLFQALVGGSMLNASMYWQGTLALILAITLFVLLTRLVHSTPLPQRIQRGD
ncbi:hypothetical protein GCM10023160_09040 [Brachybacterium paraconglomeratum]